MQALLPMELAGRLSNPEFLRRIESLVGGKVSHGPGFGASTRASALE